MDDGKAIVILLAVPAAYSNLLECYTSSLEITLRSSTPETYVLRTGYPMIIVPLQKYVRYARTKSHLISLSRTHLISEGQKYSFLICIVMHEYKPQICVTHGEQPCLNCTLNSEDNNINKESNVREVRPILRQVSCAHHP